MQFVVGAEREGREGVVKSLTGVDDTLDAPLLCGSLEVGGGGGRDVSDSNTASVSLVAVVEDEFPIALAHARCRLAVCA